MWTLRFENLGIWGAGLCTKFLIIARGDRGSTWSLCDGNCRYSGTYEFGLPVETWLLRRYVKVGPLFLSVECFQRLHYPRPLRVSTTAGTAVFTHGLVKIFIYEDLIRC